jgi:hypothetical protein
MKNISKRIDSMVTVCEDLFHCGLLDITDFLCTSLKSFLESEGRYVGIVKSYISSLDSAYEKFNETVSDEDAEVYGKILYLIKPIIVKEFNRLRSKKLSDGDCVILIIRKIISIIKESEMFSHSKELKTVSKIIERFYSNIKNKNKKDPMFNFSNQVKTLRNSGNIGKYVLDRLDLTQLKREKSILKDEDSLLVSEDSSIHEVEWNVEN